MAVIVNGLGEMVNSKMTIASNARKDGIFPSKGLTRKEATDFDGHSTDTTGTQQHIEECT